MVFLYPVLVQAMLKSTKPQAQIQLSPGKLCNKVLLMRLEERSAQQGVTYKAAKTKDFISLKQANIRQAWQLENGS